MKLKEFCRSVGVSTHIKLLAIHFTVPIIPEFLYDIRHPDAPLSSFPKTPPPPTPLPGCNDAAQQSDLTTLGYGKRRLLSRYLKL